jgi:hypothetical protein
MRDLHLAAVRAALTTLTTNNLHSEIRIEGKKGRKKIYRVKLALSERRQTLMLRDRDGDSGSGGENIISLHFQRRDTVPARRGIVGLRFASNDVTSFRDTATQASGTRNDRQILSCDLSHGSGLYACPRRGVDAERSIVRERCRTGHDGQEIASSIPSLSQFQKKMPPRANAASNARISSQLKSCSRDRVNDVISTSGHVNSYTNL